MTDLYHKLGLNKGASKADIKSAYRTLAKKYHPDFNKDDDKTAERFKEVSAAYSILGDDDQRARYDRGEIDDNGNERATMGAGGGFGSGGFGRGGGFGGFGGGFRGSSRDFDMDDAQDIFSEFFRFTGRGNAGQKQTSNPYKTSGRSKGLDINYEITVGFEESITGGTRRLRLNDGRNVDIKVPAGIQNGQVIRLAGQGGPGVGKAPKGDALVEIHVAPHPYYKRDGNDIHLELPISLNEAILGGDIQVPTPSGKLTIRIPKNSSTGKRLRLKGKGVVRKETVGNMYVTLKVMLPTDRDPELEKLIKEWKGGDGNALRKKAGLT